MHPFVFHNDRILPLAQVRLSPGQAGLLNGWGLFSTVRVSEGVPFALERHWNRLARDADRIQLPLPHGLDAIREAVHRVIVANHVQSGCIRIYFIYNRVSIWHSDEPFPAVDLIILSTDLPVRLGPTQLAVMSDGRHAANPLTGTKVTAWLNNVWHAEQARREGFEDALLLNERGEVAECTAANVFCVQAQEVFTPPASSGCLLGVTREILLEIAPKFGVPISERSFSLNELYRADEVFISSTTRNVQPVARVADRAYPAVPGSVTERLARLMSEYVRDYLAAGRQGRITSPP
jgi:branched-chain amino acid aminotransferase